MNSSASPVHILLAGGTIDCAHIDAQGVYHFKDSHVPGMLVQARSLVVSQVKEVFLKDSDHMVDDDRRLIAEHALKSRGSRIVVTHGTDSMVETAEVMARTRGLEYATITLTGAFTPYNQPNSDALFNLGAAMMAVQLLPAGIYIIMHGLAFEWFDVCKNKVEGKFETLDGGIPADRN